MSDLTPLIACAGAWHGTNRLHDPHTGAPEDSAATATVTPVLGGRFTRIDYTWSYQGRPQEGSLLVGHDRKDGTATVLWIDSWHNGDKMLVSRGTVGPDGVVSVSGTYAAPPGPDWGWRTVLQPAGAALHVVMYNVYPEGKEELAVEASFTRA